MQRQRPSTQPNRIQNKPSRQIRGALPGLGNDRVGLREGGGGLFGLLASFGPTWAPGLVLGLVELIILVLTGKPANKGLVGVNDDGANEGTVPPSTERSI